jgi:hypothetical protein
MPPNSATAKPIASLMVKLQPQEGGVDYHEHQVIKTIQPGGSMSVVKGGSKMVVIDSY